jgi:hypothetical protein
MMLLKIENSNQTHAHPRLKASYDCRKGHLTPKTFPLQGFGLNYVLFLFLKF